jgi:superfamily II DNA helicase RecQ
MTDLLKGRVIRGEVKRRQDLLISPFHRTLSREHQEQIVTKLSSGEIRCVIATVAFGMGIDVPCIRHVFLHGMLRSPAEVWQMVGRVSRDGQPEVGHLLLTGRIEPLMRKFADNLKKTEVRQLHARPSRDKCKIFFSLLP